MDIVLLSRIQFALTAAFHFIFPPVTIGMGLLIFLNEYRFYKTGEEIYKSISKFLIKIFAILFASGVATGIIMEFQFGTNWSRYSEFVGDIFGSPLAAEAIFAFFLESTFLGVLIFGRERVSRKFYLVSTFLVFIGSVLSAFWIIVANSWMQTPAGFEIQGNRAVITDFMAAIFNPSTLPRFTHTVVGCIITGAFFIMAIGAYMLLKKKGNEFGKKLLLIPLFVAAVFSLIQLFTGHWHAVQVTRTQPVKMAAFEGLFKTQQGAPMSLFGIPDKDSEELKYPVLIPKMLSLMAEFDPNAEIKGLDSVDKSLWPPLKTTFFSYHIMVAFGLFFIGLTLLGILLWFRGLLFENTLYLKLLVFSGLLPFISMQFGWIAAEVGRQPWIVQGLMKTKDGMSVVTTAGGVLFSISLFSLIFLCILALVVYLIRREIISKTAEI
ncbi:MAG: cytochrome ubiquinol oxidase subunit I [Deltaproteobacteria bacterium]|nr:cytochrome ubiquinol oxidase subunit I [Deltaproteobacteria bacterium]